MSYTVTSGGTALVSGGTVIQLVGAQQVTAHPVAPGPGHDYPLDTHDPVALTGCAAVAVPFVVIGAREVFRSHPMVSRFERRRKRR